MIRLMWLDEMPTWCYKQGLGTVECSLNYFFKVMDKQKLIYDYGGNENE